MLVPNKFPISLTLCFGILLASCGGGSDRAVQGTDTVQEDADDGARVLAVGGQVFSIPSPVETALAIRKAGLPYQKEFSTPLEKGETATGKVAQALLLGMFGADMAYVTVHGDGQRALATMQAIEKLSAKLELSNAFDRELVERFKANVGAEDSLLRFSGMAFRAADQYLKTNERDDVSALVLAGGWVASMHLTLSDPGAMGSPVLRDRVGDQQATVAGLLELLNSTDRDGQHTELIKALKDVREDLNAVTRTYSFEQPVTDAASRTTFINSKTSVNIPEERLEAIKAKVAALRNMILA